LKITIIIPTLDEVENLKTLLPYLRNNSNEETIKIVVVGASRSQEDATEVCSHNQTKYILAESTSRSSQMNLGAQLADSEIVMFLHADVYPPANFQELIEDTILNNKMEAGLFCYDFHPSSLMLKINSWATRLDNGLTGGGDQCLFLKKSIFNALGGFDETLLIMEDFDFFKRMKDANVKYKLIREPARVSSRKYDKNSWLTVNYINLMMMRKYKKGASQEELISYYTKKLKR